MPDSVKFSTPADPRHPMAVFLLALCVFTSIPTFLGKARAPGSLEATIPQERIILWAAGLTAGAILSLLGTYWRHRVTGLLIEQLGMLLVSVAGLYYAGVILYVAKLNGLQTSGIILAFGLAAGVRFWQIQHYFNQIKKAKEEGATPDGGR